VVWVERVNQFDGRPLQSIAKGQVDLDTEEEKQSAETAREEFAAFLPWMTSTLADEVKEVRLSSRLTTSPACIVGDEHDMTPTLEKMYRAMGQDVPHTKRILELNPTHPLVTALRAAHERDGENDTLKQTAELLYGMALLAEGGELKEPARFTKILADRLTTTL
jgi:molecular chaperone HtpG